MKLQNQNRWAPGSPKFLIAENVIVQNLFYFYDSCLLWDLNDGYLTPTGFINTLINQKNRETTRRLCYTQLARMLKESKNA